MQNFKLQNDIDREFYEKDFAAINKLLFQIRKSLISGEDINLSDINLSDILKYNPAETLIFITLFQNGQKLIRYGSKKSSLNAALNRNIEMIRKNSSFANFEVQNENVCRIMIEYVIDRKQISFQDLNSIYFNDSRFEVGINGLELKNGNTSYYYMPTDAITLSHNGLKTILNTLIRKTPISKITNKISERIEILSHSNEYEYFLFKSRAFISYKDTCIPLYRGNTLYKEFSYDILYKQFIDSTDWLINNMHNDGRFLYYYDCCDDTLKDHEHPTRPENNLYYNDLRHCGGIITLIRAYQITSNPKYINAAKKALDWSVSISKDHCTDLGKAYYAFYNDKAKLGGTGVLLVALMQYRNSTGDKSYDEYIKGFVRHLLSRICDSGEFLGYYIHPQYNNGKPLTKMNDKERKETFSFYYPGEALLGLALFANNFDDDNLVNIVRKMSQKALDWIVEERPKIYADLFTKLPSDAWLMQAIEEWTKDKNFQKENYIKFILNDANTMIDKMYKKDDSPYIDFEGGFYYEYGDHFYPDGARSEGLIAAYYLAKNLGLEELADRFLIACKNAAKCLYCLFNSDENNFSHKNQSKSLNSIRFKATRRWVRVDSVQHVACFFARLYKAEN